MYVSIQNFIDFRHKSVIRQFCRNTEPLSSRMQSGLIPLDDPSKKWVGVEAGAESSSTGTCVSGQELIVLSIAINKFRKIFSDSFHVDRTAVKFFFAEPIICSQLPTMCGEEESSKS